MGLYKNNNGVLSPIAGRGKAEYGASTVRKGNITFTAASPQWNVVNVTFDEPMPDADYLVDLIITSDEPSMGSCTPYMIPTKSATGFTFKMYCGASRGVTIAYTAFKLYTDNEYNGLLNNLRYSTDEIDTGKTWIDGKPIYRAVYTGDYPATTTQGQAVELFLLDHTGISNVTHVEGYFMNSSLYILPMTAYWRKSDGMIKAHQETTNGAGTYRIIIEYTKTT